MDQIVKDKKEQQKVENIIGIYITGSMMKNYASCVQEIYSGPNKHGKYVSNKMKELVLASDKALKPIQKFLKETQGEEAVDEMLILYHEVIDNIFELDEFQINRIKQLIKKIKDGR